MHDSSHSNADELDELYKDVEACHENYCNCLQTYAQGVGIPYSAVKSLSRALKKYYKTYKKEFTKEEDSSKAEETSELEINTDYIDSNWREIGICKDCRYTIVNYEPDSDSNDY